ncbi:MAG TPA: PRC-barrel domain-containing protein [Pirellulaceae bacterium]|nr:PRC-barrel domain-containing protein [Pirellulaceae bacterium]
MKMSSIFATGLAMALCLALVSVTATAQETQTKKNPVRSQIGTLDNKTSGASFRASKLIGMNIQNELGKSVGEVNDMVLDASTGKVRYLAVTYGGFLGLGNKMFAVPYEAFTCRPDTNDRDETILVLNVTQQQLDGAAGFDEDHWPDFGDTKYTNELDKRYGVDRQALRTRDRDRNVDVRVGRDGVDVDVDRKPIPRE